MLRNRSITLGLLSALLLSAFAAGVSPAADHRDSPSLGFNPKAGNNATQRDLRSLDINDVYLFQSPTTPTNTVMMMTVNPLIDAGATPEQVFFSSTGTYEFVINNGSDPSLLRPEVTFRCNFTAPRAGRQEIRVTRVNHATNRSELIARGQTGSNIAIRNGGQVQANVFDDPFFFDLNAFRADVVGGTPREFNDGREVDFFAGFNVQIIVLEVPSSSLIGGNSNVITLWARTLNAAGVQIDRMGIPTINTVLIRPNRFIGSLPVPFVPNPLAPPAASFKDQFNLTLPVNDRTAWGSEVRAALMALGNTEAEAIGAADLLLPDVLTFDVTSTLGFGSSLGPGVFNGRRLTDDVIDAELALLVKADVPARNGDGIDMNNKPFRARFPYAATPN